MQGPGLIIRSFSRIGFFIRVIVFCEEVNNQKRQRDNKKFHIKKIRSTSHFYETDINLKALDKLYGHEK